MNDYYKNRRIKALEKAKRRGEAAKKWLEFNKLTKETKPEFDKLMKSIT